MKKKVCYLAFLLLLPAFLKAQISYGPKIGLNISKMTGKFSDDDISEYKNVARFQIGGVVNFRISELLSFQPELLFSQKGFSQEVSYTDEDYNVTGEMKVTLNYLEIPLLLKLGFKINNFELYGNIGPYVAYALGGKYKTRIKYDFAGLFSEDFSGSGKIKFKSESEISTGDDIILGSDEYNRVDYGGYIGVGVGKEIGPGKLVLDFRYGHGLVDFFENANFINGQKADGYKKFQNRSFTITLSYLLSGKNNGDAENH